PECRMCSNGIRIGFLPIHAPVEQFVERNGLLGYGTAHEAAGLEHHIVTVEIANYRLCGRKALVEDVHAVFLEPSLRYSDQSGRSKEAFLTIAVWMGAWFPLYGRAARNRRGNLAIGKFYGDHIAGRQAGACMHQIAPGILDHRIAAR